MLFIFFTDGRCKYIDYKIHSRLWNRNRVYCSYLNNITCHSPKSPRRRIRHFYLAEPIAIGLCSVLDIILTEETLFSVCFIIAVIFSGITLLCILLVKFDDPELSAKTGKDQPKNKRINDYIDISTIPTAIFVMLSCFGYIALLTFSKIYSIEADLVSAFKYFFLIYMIVVIISRPLAGRFQDRYGNTIVSIVPIILQSSCLILLILYPCETVVYLSAIFTALGYGVLYSVGISMATEYVEEEREYLAISTYILFNDLALGFGATILGLFAFNGIEGIFIAAAVFGILGLPICLYVLKTHENKSI